MLRLRLFGTPQLEGPAGVIPSPGPRRLALLASLAAAGPAGLTRDKLVARLWADADDDRAKRNLSQLLYAMRTELGADLVEGTGTLRLDSAKVWSDVGSFDAALAARNDTEALDLYRGAFLDGFHLSDGPEFSEWADGEREKRNRAAKAAAIRVAESAAKTVPPDAHALSVAWHRAHSLDPLNSTLVLRLIDALDSEGNRAGAIRVADQYAAMVRLELESEPEATVVRRVEALRRAPTAGVAAATATADAPRSAAPMASVSSAEDHQPAITKVASEPTPVPRHRLRPLQVAGIAAVVVGAAAFGWSKRPPAPLRDGEFVLLAEFANHTSDTLLTRSIGTAVAAALQQSAHVVSLPRARVAATLRRMERADTSERLDVESARDVAQREGVRLVLAGEVVESGAQREVISRIIEAQSGRVLAARTFRVTDDGLLAALDRMAARMRRDLGEANATVAEAMPLPQVTTSSLEALHQYAEGISAVRQGNRGLAGEFFAQAIALDSNFASAHAQIGAYWNENNNVPKATYHFARALSQKDRLTTDERFRIMVADAYARGDLEKAVGYSRRHVELRPRDNGAWARLGFYLFSSGQHEEARAAYARADSISPLSASSILNIGTSWLSQARPTSDSARFDSARVTYERAFAMQPSLETSVFFNQQYGSILLGTSRIDEARATFDKMTARTPLDRMRGLRSNAFLDAMEGRWNAAAEKLVDATTTAAMQRQWTSAIRNDALLADLHLALGDPRAAAVPLRRGTAVALREPLETRAVAFIALAQVKAGNIADATRLLARMRAMARSEHVAEQGAILTVEGAMHLAAGRNAAARSALEGSFNRDANALQTRMLLAEALAATGSDSAAAAMWRNVAREFNFALEGQFEWQFADYRLGLVQERMGLTELAMESYRRIVGRYPAEGAAMEPVELRAARERLRRLEQGGR